MGARKDMGVTFSQFTQEEVDSFCEHLGIDSSVNPVAPGCDKSIDQCPPGFVALYCRHFDFPNLRYPFSIFVLNVLEYYRVSFGQLHPQGVAPLDNYILKFCIDISLISSLMTTLGSWKDRFFWVYESVIPCKMVWGHPDTVLNELEPSVFELDEGLLTALRDCPRLRPFPEHLLVSTGVSVLWDKPNQDPMFMRGDQVMSALDFIKANDTFDVVLGDVEAIEGEDAVTRTAEG
ncbi:hypothetical protein HanRHA438_Chr04g0172631 [Helianthus annuus]|uniref:Transposase (Putative), gypsy type n=1 Tax=Helianthus annuus TaxID=4232 RepID=A0A9K3J7I5_HELAN|nr:hypothetical protein HanXRQr2_Chr04g0162501 [Helianthus annuus]KAJ0580821.1 hypothetical protein HanHA300_Chr04g0133781 [Helianthus annuus]KAJ0588526.1 hypothetical protein HanIR_Chr04g0175681 [Helianthus annuus]KAJ0596761.1 hypothetical protein HanHA89_Chr04g0146651 [Helianthus annuus]KAJ0757441.1 hypothetical protein HanLR1_Chr04g0138781 [Helianthus annuus]